MANVAIKRHPDRLTGRGLANAGIALGLVFGLTVVTYTTVQDFHPQARGRQVRPGLCQGAQGGELRRCPAHRDADPETRKNQTAAEAEKEFEKMKSRERGMAEQRMAPA